MKYRIYIHKHNKKTGKSGYKKYGHENQEKISLDASEWTYGDRIDIDFNNCKTKNIDSIVIELVNTEEEGLLENWEEEKVFEDWK